MDDHDSDSSFENSYYNHALFQEYRVWEEQHENLGFKVDLLKFPSTLQAKGFIDFFY